MKKSMELSKEKRSLCSKIKRGYNQDGHGNLYLADELFHLKRKI